MVESVAPDWRVDGATRREYWAWTAGVLYLLLTVDLLTTLYATAIYGTGAEANPFVAAALEHGVAWLVAANLAGLCVLVGLFAGYQRLLARERGQSAWVLARSFELLLGGLLSVGLFVYANNLAVIVLGGSLL